MWDMCGGEDGLYRVFVEKPEGRKPLGRYSNRRDGNIKMDLQEIGWNHGFD
jgi:hypothetical protein